MSLAVEFPQVLPPGYDWLDGEPPFDPGRHLQLEPPASVVTLAELGYTDAETAELATPIAISAPFRVLSDEGAAVLLDVARRLQAFTRPAGNRIERMVRAGCYRSRWLRDLCLSADVTALLGRVYGTAVAPHPMVAQLGHLNYEPLVTGAPVDKWHHDTLPLDYVLMVSDPATLDGGHFEYFTGTRAEAAALAGAGRTPPEDRRVPVAFPGPGWAVALHGNMVVHRAAALRTPGERITMVNGYVAADTALPAQSRIRDLIGVDDDAFLYTDWARFVAWRARGRLGRLIDDLAHGVEPAAVVAELERAVQDVTDAVAEMRAGPQDIAHYETGGAAGR